MKIKYLFICILWIFVCNVGYAQNTIWTGLSSSDISLASNWSRGLPISPKTGIISACISPCNIPTLTADVNFNNITVKSRGEIQLNNWKLTTNAIIITINSVINSNGGELITNMLTNISGSTFNGNIKIIVNDSGGTSGGNTFNGKLDLELSSVATDALSLNKISPSIHKGDCTFTNKSSQILTIASHAQTTGESTFEQNCVINNNNDGTINVASGGAQLKFDSKITINNLIGQTSISNTKGVCTVKDIVMNNSGGTINTADNINQSKLIVTNSLKANFIGTVSNIGTINLNRVTHTTNTDNIMIDASNGILNVTNSSFACFISLKGGNNLVSIANNTFSKNFTVEGTGSVAINLTGTNSFGGDIILDRSIDAFTNNPTIKLTGTEQHIKTTIVNGMIRQNIYNLDLSSATKTFIDTPIAVTNNLKLGNTTTFLASFVVNSLPSLEIGILASITNPNQSYVIGPIRKIINTQTSATFLFPVGAIKYEPLTLSNILPSGSVSVNPAFITVEYKPTPSSNSNTTTSALSDCEYWKFSANFQGGCKFSLNNIKNSCTIRDNGTNLKAFLWQGSGWSEPMTTVSVVTLFSGGVLNSATSFSFQATDNEITLGYKAILEIDVSEVASKKFTFSSQGLTLSGTPLGPYTSGGQTKIALFPVFARNIRSGQIIINIDGSSASFNSSIVIPFPISQNDPIKITNSASSTSGASLSEFYKITMPSVAITKIKFYKTPQATNSLPAITTNLSNGVTLQPNNLILTFASSARYTLNIYKSDNTLNPPVLATVAMPATANTLTWTPVSDTIAPGSYKFTLTDLTTSTIVYQGQFIK